MYEEYTKHICNEVTEEIKKFVRDEIFRDSEYLFVTRVGDRNQGYCSKCNHEYDVENIRHNASGVCPICGASLTVKISRYGRKKCKNEACFYYFEKSIVDPNVVVCKGYYVAKDYARDYKKPQEEYSLEAIYIFEDKKATMLKKSYGSYWHMRNSIFDFNQGWFAPKMCYCSFDSIEKAIKGTGYQYIPYKTFQGHYSMVKLFREYAKYPWIEQISKIGFVDIIKAKLKGEHIYGCLNYRGKDIFKILRLSRKDVKDIKESKQCITPRFLSLYQMQVKDKSGLSPAEVKSIEDLYGYNYAKLYSILQYTTMRKAFRYMQKQYKKYKKQFYTKGSVVTTWSDYIDDCLKLEMDLSSDNVLYPKDVYSAHQNTINQIQIKANKEVNKKILKRLSSVNNKYYFEYQDLIIRAAESADELITEGKTLNHCVGNYAKRYAQGEISILFIRKISSPDKPYFTVEVAKNTIIQIHGKNNCNPNEEIKRLIEAFKTEKLNKKKSKVRISVPA